MNLRHLPNRISPSMLVLLIGASLLGLPTRSVSAQSFTVTTPFAFCINNHAYPKGRYRFTPISQWLVSIRNVNETDESFFEVHPEADGPRQSVGDPIEQTGGLIFHTVHGIRELQSVYVPSSDASFELVDQNLLKANLITHRSLNKTA